MMANRYFPFVRTLKLQGNPPVIPSRPITDHLPVALPPVFLFNDIHGVFLYSVGTSSPEMCSDGAVFYQAYGVLWWPDKALCRHPAQARGITSDTVLCIGVSVWTGRWRC